MQKKQVLIQFYCVVAVVSVMLAGLVGCNQTGTAKSNAEAGTASLKKLPKMKFHRPDSFPAAVARLSEIQEVINSDSALPEPKVFQVVEVIHGTGPGAHSHYHLASAPVDHSHDHDDHAHGESNEKNHEVEVDVITEMTDIVKWMPDIAGDTDMDKDSWSSVKTESESLYSQLKEALSTAAGPEEQRKAVQKLQSKLLAFTDAMGAVVAGMDNSGEDSQESSKE